MKDLVVYCVDVGSVKAGNFGWARGSAALPGEIELGTDPQLLCSCMAEVLRSGGRVALGFECPLFVPFRDDPAALTLARRGEGNRPWCAGAGAGSLAVGLVQTTWVLAELGRAIQRSVRATLDWKEFAAGSGELFLWEAFVSAEAKADKAAALAHANDAAIAVRRFLDSMEDLPAGNAIAEDSVQSLIGAAMLRTGWSDDPALLRKSCIVVKA